MRILRVSRVRRRRRSGRRSLRRGIEAREDARRLDALSLVLGGEGRGEGPSIRVRVDRTRLPVGSASRTVLVGKADTRSAMRTLRDVVNTAIRAQSDVPPLTLTLSPEYEGEGTRGGSSAKGNLPQLTLESPLLLECPT